ncbi:MAG: anthranilate synthase component I, partial [Luminiphilus sp.]|nr:anthranilate synthase component I [Luminiphilus sp.]MDG1064836.1 anthranilate synthase component I [Luminiphilus sp.]
MDQQTFDALIAEGYNRIPVSRTILADMETPLSAYHKFAAGPFSFLFESVQGGEKWG